jgi:hypothetical protein
MENGEWKLDSIIHFPLSIFPLALSPLHLPFSILQAGSAGPARLVRQPQLANSCLLSAIGHLPLCRTARSSRYDRRTVGISNLSRLPRTPAPPLNPGARR